MGNRKVTGVRLALLLQSIWTALCLRRYSRFLSKEHRSESQGSLPPSSHVTKVDLGPLGALLKPNGEGYRQPTGSVSLVNPD